MWSVMLLLCLEDENVLATFHTTQSQDDSPPPPQLITTVSNAVWKVFSFLRAAVTQLIWLPANSALALIAASNKWAKTLHQVMIANLKLARPTGGWNLPNCRK